MTIDRAIIGLSEIMKCPNTISQEDGFAAIKLGIEALKAVKECRASHMFCPGLTMEGESKEKAE